ncbi:MAG: ATP-binding protein [Myxococcota bacterium]
MDRAVILLDEGERVVLANPRAQLDYGVAVGVAWRDIVGETELVDWRKIFSRTTIERTFYTDIERIGVAVRVFACARSGGGVMLSLQTVPLGLNAEARLRAYERVLARYGVGLWQLELPSGKLRWSPACFDLIGIPAGPISTEAYLERVHPEDQDRIGAAMNAASTGQGEYAPCFRVPQDDGRVHHLQDRSEILARGPDGMPLFAVGATLDRTAMVMLENERDQLLNRLSRIEQLSVAGRLASSVAHDLNNVLTVVLANCELLKEDADPDAAASLEDVLTAGRHAAELASRLLDVARRAPLKPVDVELQPFLKQRMGFLGSLVPETVTMTIDDGAPGVWIRVDPQRFQQAVYNLVLNAGQAARATVHLEMAATDVDVRLSVIDDGPGIRQEVRDRIFEPFFSTRENGTGLGLASVEGIVEQHGGTIVVTSTHEQGSSFTITLPRAAPGAPAVAPPRPTQERHQTVWVVEDHRLLRVVVGRILGGAGYHWETFADPERALQRLQAGDLPPDLLLTDVMMAPLTGPELVAAAKVIHPELPVLYMSGHAKGLLTETGVVPNVTLLNKPFTSETLLEAVAHILQ